MLSKTCLITVVHYFVIDYLLTMLQCLIWITSNRADSNVAVGAKRNNCCPCVQQHFYSYLQIYKSAAEALWRLGVAVSQH